MTDIFCKLLEMSISAGWLIMAIIILRLFFKKVPRKIVCCLWALAALRLILPFNIESRLSLVPDVKLPAAVREVDRMADREHYSTGNSLPDDTNNIVGYLPADAANSQKDSSLSTGMKGSTDNSVSNVDNNQVGTPDTVNTAADSAAADQSMTNKTDTPAAWTAIDIASIIWIAGAAVLIVYALITYVQLIRRTRASVKVGNNIYICDDIDTPFILGVFRTRIYLPSFLSDKEREYVLAHESAHLKRLDNLWKPLGYIILAVYWFNPLVWVSYVLLCRDIEIACDERVIADKDTEYKKQYAATLLNCSADRDYIAACPLAFGEVGVKQRIKAVLNYKRPAFWIIIVAVAACIIVAVGFMTNPINDNSDSEKETGSESVGVEESSESGDTREPETYEPAPIVMKSIVRKGWRIWAHERPEYSYTYSSAELAISMGDSYIRLTSYDLGNLSQSYDELKQEENLGMWYIAMVDGTLEEFTESAGVGLSIYEYEERIPITSDKTPGTGYMLIYGESGNDIVWYMMMPVGMTLEEVKDFASDIHVELVSDDGKPSVMEQYERAESKISFLMSYTEEGESVFDLYAAELKEKRPEKYEKLKDSAEALCMLADIEPSFCEVYHNDVGWDIVMARSAEGQYAIASMRLIGEIWRPWTEYDPRDFDSSYYVARDASLKALTADELRLLDNDEANPVDKLLMGGEGYLVLSKLEGEDTVLYGDYSGKVLVLRHGDKLIPVRLGYLSPRMYIPELYSGDFDNDGKTEYSIWVCAMTGTGVSCDQLFMLETDWNEGDDGTIEYSISEYQSYYWLQECRAIDAQYDENDKLLSVMYNGELVDTIDLTRLLEETDGEYGSVTFGEWNTFTYRDGAWYFLAEGGVRLKNGSLIHYDYGVYLEGRVVYDGHNFGLENVRVWTQVKDADTN